MWNRGWGECKATSVSGEEEDAIEAFWIDVIRLSHLDVLD